MSTDEHQPKFTRNQRDFLLTDSRTRHRTICKNSNLFSNKLRGWNWPRQLKYLSDPYSNRFQRVVVVGDRKNTLSKSLFSEICLQGVGMKAKNALNHYMSSAKKLMTRHSRFNNRTVERKSVLLLWPSKRKDKDLQPPKKGCKWKWTKRRTYKCTNPNSSTTRKYLAKKKKIKCELWSPSVYSLLMSVFENNLSEFDMFSWSFKEDNKFKCRKLLFTVQYINSSQMDLLSNERIL